MAESGNPGLADEVAAALAWWRQAGVDACFLDEPVNWLAEREAFQQNQAKPQPLPSPRAGRDLVPPGGSSATDRSPRLREDSGNAHAPLFAQGELPEDLAAFADWWLTEPRLDDGRITDRVPPRGPAGAELMILVAEPEREDSERLLSGPQGRLLDGMLAAMGLSQQQVYVASALPRHTPMADWSGLTARGHGEVLRRHIALAAPRRLIAFGSNVLPLLGNDPPNLGQFFTRFNHEGMEVPLWTAADLGVLLARPRAKARIWQQYLELGSDWAPVGAGPDRMGS